MLGVGIEELRGTVPLPPQTPQRTARLLKRLQRIEDVPPAEQRTILTLIDAFLARRGLKEAS